MQIFERLKEARKNSGMTQEEVAEKIMVSRVTLSHWENGKTLPDIASLISLSDLYEITLDELVKGDPKMTEKVKKDSKKAQTGSRIIITTVVLMIAVGVLYLVCRLIGGGLKEFAEGAIQWVILAIGAAGALTYINMNADENK